MTYQKIINKCYLLIQKFIFKNKKNKKLTPFELYCEKNPDALECRIYDI